MIPVESCLVRVATERTRVAARPEEGDLAGGGRKPARLNRNETRLERVRGATRRRRRPGRPTSTSSGPRSPASTKTAPMGAEHEHVDRSSRPAARAAITALGPHPDVQRVERERHRAGAERPPRPRGQRSGGSSAHDEQAAARSRPARCRSSARGRRGCRCGAPRSAATRRGCRSGWCRTTRCAPGPAACSLNRPSVSSSESSADPAASTRPPASSAAPGPYAGRGRCGRRPCRRRGTPARCSTG